MPDRRKAPSPSEPLAADATMLAEREPAAANWLDLFNHANSLHAAGQFALAAEVYRQCYRSGHPYPAEALSASLLCRLKAAQPMDAEGLAELQDFDPSYLAYLRGAERFLAHHDALGALEACGNAYEAFHTGTEADRFFLRAAAQYFAKPAIVATPAHGGGRLVPVNAFPANLIFYWHAAPPAEVAANFAYHRTLPGFFVQVFDKPAAEAFLYDYFGREAKTQFTRLRHPSEEADYFRAHAMYVYGGCYLDADLRLRSPSSLMGVVPYACEAVAFLTDGSLVHNDLILVEPKSPLMAECINVIVSNCAHFPSLSIDLKTGPGAFTRAINRLFFRRLAFNDRDPDLCLLGQADFDRAVEGYDVTYKQAGHNWQAV